MNKNSILEVWGYKTYRPFRIYWVLHEFNLSFESNKIGLLLHTSFSITEIQS